MFARNFENGKPDYNQAWGFQARIALSCNLFMTVGEIRSHHVHTHKQFIKLETHLEHRLL